MLIGNRRFGHWHHCALEIEDWVLVDCNESGNALKVVKLAKIVIRRNAFQR